MAFNGIGTFIWSSPEPFRVWISFQGQDLGAQWIMAHPIGPGFFQMSDFAKERRIEPGKLTTFYWATVRNINSDDLEIFGLFSLSGGGNI